MREEFFVDRKRITRPPVRPGILFARNILPSLGRRTISEIATLLNVGRQSLHRVMAGQSAVSPDMAVRLGKLCGNGPDLWLALQARYDAWESSHRLANELKRIPTLRE